MTTMPRPIAGIEQVANAADLIPRQRAETDEELRQRARAQARSANTGTVAALEQAVRTLGIREVRVLEYPVDPALLPGKIHVVIGDPDLSPQLLEQVADRIEQVRPAGIQVSSGAATRHTTESTVCKVSIAAWSPAQNRSRLRRTYQLVSASRKTRTVEHAPNRS